MKITDKIEILLFRNNLKKVDFCDKLGITYRAFAYYMSETRRPRKKVIEKMAAVLGVSPEFLNDDSQELELSLEEKLLKNMSDRGENTNEASKFLSASRGLFAGNSLSEEDKKALIKCLTEIYEDSRKGK